MNSRREKNRREKNRRAKNRRVNSRREKNSEVAVSLFVAGAVFRDVGASLPVAGAVFGEVAVLLLVAGAAFGKIWNHSRGAKCVLHSKCISKARKVTSAGIILGLWSDLPSSIW